MSDGIYASQCVVFQSCPLRDNRERERDRETGRNREREGHRETERERSKETERVTE